MKREHSLRYPAFTYKPSPKRHIKPRRQSRTREQQIAAVEELMEQYLPDEGGSVPHNRVSITTEARKTRTYTKSRQAPPQPPHDSVAKNDAEAHNSLLPSKDEPVFMEPLRPPSPIIYRPMSWAWPEANQVGQPSISTTGHKESAMVHRSFTSFNFPQQEWQVDSMSNLQVQSPPDVIDVSESFPDVVEHIRGQYDSAPRSEIPPTVALIPIWNRTFAHHRFRLVLSRHILHSTLNYLFHIIQRTGYIIRSYNPHLRECAIICLGTRSSPLVLSLRTHITSLRRHLSLRFLPQPRCPFRALSRCLHSLSLLHLLDRIFL